MKVKSLKVVNIGIVENEEVVFNKPLNLFFGDIKSGKTTIAINSIKLLFGGSFPTDILRHGTSTGFVELSFDNATITRKFYKNRSGETKAKGIEFFVDNKKVEKPVEAIQKLINPFLLDQEFFSKKTGIERQRFFMELFNVDTTDIDSEIKDLSEDAKELRSQIKAYGEIEITPIEKPNIDILKKKKEEIENRNLKMSNEFIQKREAESERVVEHNRNVRIHNRDVERFHDEIKSLTSRIKTIESELEDALSRKKRFEDWLNDPKNKAKEEIESVKVEKPVLIDITEIEEKISNAKADQIRFEQYQKDLQKQEEKEYHIGLLSDNEAKIKSLRQDKIDKLKSVSDNTGIKDLYFDANGNVVYQNTSIDMLSTAQLIQLKSALMSLYPNELGIELLDRAESLGRSIYEYIDKARKEDLTILATIVSHGPAKNVPEDCSVFVVETGKIISQAP